MILKCQVSIMVSNKNHLMGQMHF